MNRRILHRIMIEESRYVGCFKGLAIGDAYGAHYEGGIAERLLWRLLGKTKDGRKRYTDDTQMSLDIATSFLANNSIDQDHLAQTFSNSYRWSRGYGPSAGRLLVGIRKGEKWQSLNRRKFKDGSMGNGAGMRAPLVALCYPKIDQDLEENVRKSAEITHAHPLAIAGAQIIASATVMSLYGQCSKDIISSLIQVCDNPAYKTKLENCERLLVQKNSPSVKDIKLHLGNGMLALDSCVTAIYFGLKYTGLKFNVMLNEICRLGGDADTIAAMAGAIWGASNGSESIEVLANNVENIEKIEALARELYQKHLTS